MKYFTYSWWKEGQDPDFNTSLLVKPISDYKNYFRSIETSLPANLREFFKAYTYHDATVKKIEIGMLKRELRLSMYLYPIKPDASKGEEVSGVITYRSVSDAAVNNSDQPALPGTPGLGDLGYDEIELFETGELQHRLLFSSGRISMIGVPGRILWVWG